MSKVEKKTSHAKKKILEDTAQSRRSMYVVCVRCVLCSDCISKVKNKKVRTLEKRGGREKWSRYRQMKHCSLLNSPHQLIEYDRQLINAANYT